MNYFLPTTSGEYPTEVSTDFLSALSDRVHSGLFPMASARRNAYEVVSHDDSALRFRSTNVLSGINVGLNDVTVTLDRETGGAKFTIAYWTWAKYAVGLSLVICGAMLLVLTAGRPIFPAAWFRDFDRAPALSWSILVFFGLVWPWLLIELHKPNVRRCLIGILDEVNG